MYHVDLHAHTRFFHSIPEQATPYDPIGARLLGRTASARGLDAVALTNHDYYEPFADSGVTFIPGIEVTTTKGHVLVVGPDPPDHTEAGTLTPEEVVEEAHDRDCAAILPHPFRSSSVRESQAPFDAVELNGKHPDTHDRVRRLAEERSLPMTGGSDAHFPFEAARGFTRVEAEELTPESVVEAVRDGRVEPIYRGGPLERLLQPAYRTIHKMKGAK
ncbi:PHP domain-containing protein [Natronomonas salina]|uniref:PHP domain-containing protein n=1 Tax=Natronomonas salina TaxID=1710540 RepID=UPI0015B4D793|nr:PHP domain-containing protein [Natronomonas salina]QLD90905.1 PHP domain-containing protein [Natronomonas salina]